MTVLILWIFLGFSVREANSGGWEWFDEHPRDFKPLLADPRESQLKVGFLKAGDGRDYLEFNLGGHLGVARRQIGDSAVAIDVRGLSASRFQFQSRSFDLHNTDFIGGLSAVYRVAHHAFELLIFHQSSHLGDDLIVRGEGFENVSFQVVRLLYGFDLTGTSRTYGGVSRNLGPNPTSLSGAMVIIAGFDWEPISKVILAVDLRLRSESDLIPDLSVHLAYELGSSAQARPQRLFFDLYNGASPHGQLSAQREFYGMAGVAFTI